MNCLDFGWLILKQFMDELNVFIVCKLREYV